MVSGEGSMKWSGKEEPESGSGKDGSLSVMGSLAD